MTDNHFIEILNSWFHYSNKEPLLFTRPGFWLFFLFTYSVFALIYNKISWRNIWLFGVSLFFYFKASGLFFILIVLSIIVNFYIGKGVYSAKSTYRKKQWVAFAVFYNLIWLVYFKYTYLIFDSINYFFGTNYLVKDWLLEEINKVSGSTFNATAIFLPVGISFYSFQIVSYIIDLYRNHVKPIKNVIDFGFYVTFFPQLVAGPIVRAASFVPQMYRPLFVYREEIGQAWFLIVSGLVKKIIVADYLALNFVDRVFDNPMNYSGLEHLFSIYGYSIQIYCDFSGYTDIAIGLAMMMGFRLPLNFNSPYKADSITDFWRRWHISLSTWLKDYLYIPLGGNRKGKIRTYINLFITMLLGGLWHGASLRFVIWGGLHGLYLAVHKMISSSKTKTAYKIKFKWIKILFTFHLVTLTWIPFRADSMETVANIFSQILHNFHGEMLFPFISSYYKVFIVMVMAFIIHWLPSFYKGWIKARMILAPDYIKAILSIIFILILVQFSNSDLQPFIYFQF